MADKATYGINWTSIESVSCPATRRHKVNWPQLPQLLLLLLPPLVKPLHTHTHNLSHTQRDPCWRWWRWWRQPASEPRRRWEDEAKHIDSDTSFGCLSPMMRAVMKNRWAGNIFFVPLAAQDSKQLLPASETRNHPEYLIQLPQAPVAFFLLCQLQLRLRLSGSRRD